MQIFELHFNPKVKKDYSFDTFIYRPEKSSEKRLGGLYALGEVKSSLPQDLQLLNNLAENIKKNFYSSLVKTPEASLTESLRTANSFLSKEVQNNNVHWMGNLGFAALSIKDIDLSFTKTGNVKILLAREGNIINMGESLEKQEINPYPLKVFFNVVSGKLEQGDLVMIMTEDIYNFLLKRGLVSRLADKGSGIEEEDIKGILPYSLFKKGGGADMAGALLLIALKKEIKKESPTTILFQNQKGFSWQAVFEPILRAFGKLKEKIPQKTKKKGSKKNKRLLPSFSFRLSKRIVLVLLLLAILLLGFLLFSQKQERDRAEIRDKLNSIEEKLAEAENYSIFDQTEKANNILKKAWKEISSLPEETPKTKTLRQTVEQKLLQLNNLEEIEDPPIIFDAGSKELNFDGILAAGSSIYLQADKGIYQVSPKEQFVPSNQIINLGTGYQNTAIFYSSPANIVSLKDQEWVSESIDSYNKKFLEMVSYWSNLYFLTEDCRIVKYPSVAKLQWGEPREWLKTEFSCSNPRSLAIDGSVWILDGDNRIWELYQGDLENSIDLDIFPFVEEIKKIATNATVSYLYLLEPAQKRIIIIEKDGKLVKQIRSNRFSNLKDFTISENGKLIWALDRKGVYQIEVNP